MGWAPVRTKTARVGCALLALILLASWPFEAWASSQVQTLSDPGQDASVPQVAVDADGDAVVVWMRSDGTNFRVQARRRSAAGALSAVQTLSPAGQDASDPQVAVDADGDAVVVWERFDGTNWRVQARRSSASGALSAVQTLSDPGRNALESQVAVDADGDAVVVWQRFDGSNERIQARRRSAAGALSAVQTLSDPGRNAIDPQVAVDVDGDAVVVWRRFFGTNGWVQARAQARSGSLRVINTLSDPDPAGPFSEVVPQVAIDRDGDAVVVWARSDGTSRRVEAAEMSAI